MGQSNLARRGESGEDAFPILLKSWRKKRRISQLALAMASGVSQRHISFLESARANPSRRMILQLSEALEVPLRDRNDWLTAAGFAAVYKARPLEHPQMSQVMRAVQMMLANHAPFPAVAVDRAWNIRLSNTAFDLLTSMMGDDVWEQIGGGEHNLMRLFFHPNGIKPFITNWATVAPLLWSRAEREAEALGGHEMQQILSELSPNQGEDVLWAAEDAALVPVLPLEIKKDGVSISVFTVFSTFGTAQDVTADELRIESMFPADEATERLFRNAVGH